MPAFFDDITPFYGAVKRNEKGQTLEEFLDAYDPRHYEQPSVTADILVVAHPSDFNRVEEGLSLLMVKRANHPSIGKWALPGGFVDIKEDVQDAAARELMEETGLSQLPLEQIHTWGDWKRDPRARIITVAHLALVEEGRLVRAGDDAADACFFSLSCHCLDSVEESGRLTETYRFSLSNAERKEHLSFTLQESSRTDCLLPQYEYRLLANEGVAFDHPFVIGQGILYLKRRLAMRDLKAAETMRK